MPSVVPDLRPPLRAAWVLALLAAMSSGPAPAQSQSDPGAAGKRLDAELRATALVRRGQWVELPTGGPHVRQFLAEVQRNEDDNSVLAHLRFDHQPAADSVVASTVQTVWLHCDAGQQRVVASYGYDVQGHQVFANKTPDAPLQAIERLYTGRAQLICSQFYTLLEVADGYARLGQLLQARRAERAAALADRPVPVPQADAPPQPAGQR